MNPKKILKQARRLFKGEDYLQAIRLLEKEVFYFRGNPDYYLLLSLSYLRLNDLKAAKTYLETAKNIAPSSREVQQVTAIFNIAQGEEEKALSLWISILDQNPLDSMANNGLEILRTHSREPFSQWVNSPEFKSLTPNLQLDFTLRKNKPLKKVGSLSQRNRFKRSLKKWLLYSIALICIPIFIFLIGLGLSSFNKWLTPKRMGVDVIILSPEDPIIAKKDFTNDSNIQYVYDLSESEVMSLFTMIKDEFNNYNDNLALMYINRLLLSNASEEVKKKAQSLMSFTTKPTFASFKEGASLQEVSRNPILYENTYVLWKGQIANLKETAFGYGFDLLVGYTDNKVLEGVVPCLSNLDILLGNGMNIEIIGKVNLEENQPFFYLEITSIHLLGS